MGTAGRRMTLLAAAATAVMAVACSTPDVDGQATVGGAVEAIAARSASTAPASTVAAAVAPSSTAAPVPSTAAPAPVAAPDPPVAVARQISEQAWTPFATVGGVTLLHPSRRVERVGFHQSNHDGARPLESLPTTVAALTMEDRERDTPPRTAADVVADPNTEIRAPVTGTVKRAGRYVLYCKHSDDYVVIAPDSQPGWEVKMLHIDGVRVRPGDRVVAGVTVLAPRPTQLPFASQVDDLSAVVPAWPHVHIEVVDPSIPDRPTPGGGCN